LDEFFQKLREIQKKERSVSGLSRVGDDFYHQIFSYFNQLMERIDNNPFSFESYLLRDAQRIVTEICERREHKISNSAVMNVQRSYLLFKDSNKDILPKAPLNSTPEEEALYKELFQSLVNYRYHMRAPLVSHSKNKSQFLNPHIKPELTKSESKKAFKVIDKSAKVNKQVKTTDGAEPSQTSVNKNNIANKAIKTNQDEIPPEIEAEIYREFGKEPSPERKVSEEGISEPLKVGSGQEAKGVKEKISTEMVMILDELPSIMGVDSKVYGPFYPGDVITMPEPNARILIKNQKGKSIQRYK
jgi:DNA replication factor GINS